MATEDKTKDFQAITEVRALATAVLSDNIEVRQKVFDFGYFSSATGSMLHEKMSSVYINNPDADYSAFVSVLLPEEQNIMLTAMKNAVLPEVDEPKLDSVLEMLRQMAINAKMKREIVELSLSSDFTPDDIRKIADDAEKSDCVYESNLNNYIANYNTPIERIPTGYAILDQMLNGGFARGTIGALGARPSVGKTTLAVNIAVHNPNFKILFFSLEMSARMIYDKIVSNLANIDYSTADKHNVDINTIKTTLAPYSNLIIIDNAAEIESIIEIIRRVKPDLVFIDYIQIVQSRKEFDSVRLRINYISQLLKRTAKQLNACVISLSQLSRNASEEPTMSALKESGGLEQDSDYVILLKRPYVTNKSDSNILPSDTTLKIDKNKFGETGEIKYFFDGKHQRFSENDDPVAHVKKEEDDTDDLPF